MEATLQTLFDAVVTGDRDETLALVQRALEEGFSPEQILQQALIAAMGEVGERFERGDFFVPEMLIAARAMQAGLDLLRPRLAETGVPSVGKVVMGTVKGDLHDIGKNLVGMMLQGAGFEIVDLGTDVPPEKFAAAVREHGAQLLGMSALLTTTMPHMGETIEALEDMGVRAQVQVMVGGAPVTEAFAQKIGADGYAPDASRAVALAKSLIG
jgi:5-methyltetrahydrofolate--homocysteine methyltransferase